MNDHELAGLLARQTGLLLLEARQKAFAEGKIKEGDYIITSNIKGHGKGVDPNYIYDQKFLNRAF